MMRLITNVLIYAVCTAFSISIVMADIPYINKAMAGVTQLQKTTIKVYGMSVLDAEYFYVGYQSRLAKHSVSTGELIQNFTTFTNGASTVTFQQNLATSPKNFMTSISNAVQGSFFFCGAYTFGTYRFDTDTDTITRMTGDGSTYNLVEGTGTSAALVCSSGSGYALSSAQSWDGTATYMMSYYGAANSYTYLMKLAASRSTSANGGVLSKIAGNGMNSHIDGGLTVGAFKDVNQLTYYKNAGGSEYVIVAGSDTGGPIRFVSLATGIITTAAIPYHASATTSGTDGAAQVPYTAALASLPFADQAYAIGATPSKLYILSWATDLSSFHIGYQDFAVSDVWAASISESGRKVLLGSLSTTNAYILDVALSSTTATITAPPAVSATRQATVTATPPRTPTLSMTISDTHPATITPTRLPTATFSVSASKTHPKTPSPTNPATISATRAPTISPSRPATITSTLIPTRTPPKTSTQKQPTTLTKTRSTSALAPPHEGLVSPTVTAALPSDTTQPDVPPPPESVSPTVSVALQPDTPPGPTVTKELVTPPHTTEEIAEPPPIGAERGEESSMTSDESGLSKNEKIGLGVGLGLGIPIVLTVSVAIVIALRGPKEQSNEPTWSEDLPPIGSVDPTSEPAVYSDPTSELKEVKAIGSNSEQTPTHE
jgi:hypothetical protein